MTISIFLHRIVISEIVPIFLEFCRISDTFLDNLYCINLDLLNSVVSDYEITYSLGYYIRAIVRLIGVIGGRPHVT